MLSVAVKWSLCWLFVIGSFIWSSILVIISMIICWPKAWLLYKVCFCGRDFVEPHKPVMVETGIVRQGFRGSSPRVWPFLLEKGSIMVWSPDTYSCWNTYYYGVMLVRERSRLKVPKDRGWHIWGFVISLGKRGSRPCLAEIQLGSRGVLPEAFPCGNRKFLSLTICWKSNQTIRALYDCSCSIFHLRW